MSYLFRNFSSASVGHVHTNQGVALTELDTSMSTHSEPIADSVAVAAKRMGVSRSYVYLQIQARKISASKAGSRTLISRVEQDRWLTALPRLEVARGK